jgi:excisionase family DNA binding protein
MSPDVSSASQLLTSQEVASKLSVSRSMVWRLAREGRLTPLKIKSATRFDSADVDRLIEEAKANG